MRKFLDFLCGREPESDLTKGIASAVEKVKEDKNLRRQYMFLSEMMGGESLDFRIAIFALLC